MNKLRSRKNQTNEANVGSHPYISGPGNIAQVVALLRRNFPSAVTYETVKKYGLASNNESYVINALQFLGVIDDDGRRTAKGHDVFVLGDDAFPAAFEHLVRDAYKDLFDLRGEEAWTLTKTELTSYFRTTDKTSEVIGSRQAGVFQIFRTLAGHDQPAERAAIKPKPVKSKPAVATKNAASSGRSVSQPDVGVAKEGVRKDMGLTVRIEINLPGNASQETYDSIFKSIRANLLDGQ